MKLWNRLVSSLKYRSITFPNRLNDPSELEWPQGWQAVHYDSVGPLTQELIRELPIGHRLHSLPACVMGRRLDRDDFLYQIEDPEYRFALVHLTWKSETDTNWPATSLFHTFSEFLASLDRTS